MSARPDLYDEPLRRALDHSRTWLSSLPERPVGPRSDADALIRRLAQPLPEEPGDPAAVVDELAAGAEDGLMAIPSGRFFGWVMGGTLPAALAADWLVSAWDQNAGLRYATPAMAALEHVAGTWLLELLGLPAGCDVGFTTGATMANFTGLAAARHRVLADVGWDVSALGLNGAPRVRVVVGEERHDSVDLALRYLGHGLPTAVAADDQGRLEVAALRAELASGSGPTIVCLQAGNLHSGAFDPMAAAIEVAHEHGAWVHVDGAFGLWAAASPSLRPQLAGVEAADSWATDAHKTLNVPYDCGICVVRDTATLRAAMGLHTAYLISDGGGTGEPFEKVPELSRRARGVPTWAALRSLGRSGVVALVDGLVDVAARLTSGLREIPGVEICNDVVFTQICMSFGSDERTREVTQRVIADGTAWMSGSRWQGRDVLRISVSNWSTDDADVVASIDAVRRAAAG